MNSEDSAYQTVLDISAFPTNSSVEWGWLNLDDTYRQNVLQTIVAHDHTALQQVATLLALEKAKTRISFFHR
jgi:hypothetical protein